MRLACELRLACGPVTRTRDETGPAAIYRYVCACGTPVGAILCEYDRPENREHLIESLEVLHAWQCDEPRESDEL